MSTGIWSAASGAVGQMTALEVSANNLVNTSTPGFRSDNSVFRQTLVKAIGANPGSRSMRYVTTRTSVPDMSTGQIVNTGRALDVAIPDDKGLFVISTPNGERYTRAGNFQLRADGRLTTIDGALVLGTNRHPIKVDRPAAGVSITPEGTVVCDGIPGQKLAIVRFSSPADLERGENVRLRARPGARPPVPHEVMLETGALELSNESSIGGMADEINTARQFDMAARVIEAFSSIEHKAATEIARR